ncbi:MAG: hypothetical protein ACRD2N_11115 [Vicinamibacterales bacterium]
MGTQSVIDVESYCREIEAYLCRKNDGHLIRIVGPAFEQVTSWARQGIPLRVAETGVDRYFERYYRKGPRRRPVRIEFCEPDVLDAFDRWRRAVGVTTFAPVDAADADLEDQPPIARSPKRSLAAHLESLVARLTILRGSDKAGPVIGAVLDETVRAIDEIRPHAGKARGDAREILLIRLTEIDRRLLAAATSTLSSEDLARLDREALEEVETFRSRMPGEAFERARRAARDRLVRHHFSLPEIER